MKLPQDMSIGNRITVTMVIVLAILFALALFGYLTGRWDEAVGAPAKRYEVPERFQRELIDLDKRSLDESYIEHANHLWKTYVSQVSNLGHDTGRIDTGLDHLHQAWVIARERIEKREKALSNCAGC